jgi:hypothetical protein
MIRKLTFPAIVVFFFALLTAFTAEKSQSGDYVTIKKGKLIINAHNVAAKWSITEAIAGLGAPERSRDGYNKTHTYDSKCVVIFEAMSAKVPTGRVTEVQFHFSIPKPNNVTPKLGYTGAVKIDKLKVDGSLSATKMLASLKKWKKTDSFIEHSYRMASNGLYIYFQFNDAETMLEKISIGPDKK